MDANGYYDLYEELFDGIGAVLAATAAGAVFASPDAIKLLTGGIYQRCFIG